MLSLFLILSKIDNSVVITYKYLLEIEYLLVNEIKKQSHYVREAGVSIVAVKEELEKATN